MKNRCHSCLRKIVGFGALVGIASLMLPAWGHRTYANPSGGGGSPGYDLSWFTIDGGGVMFSSGDDYELSGTIGQPDAGAMADGDFTLTGGFWFPIVAGDCNTDGGVNLFDYDTFEACMSGPDGVALPPQCPCFDLDNDADVDLVDFRLFQMAYSGS